MDERYARSDDGGETLVELIVAVVILGITAVSIVGGIGVSILMSDIHHKQATAGAAVRDFAEKVESFIAAGGYVNCATTAAYSASQVGYVAPAGYTPAVTSVTYWEDATTTPAQATPAFYGPSCPTKTNGVPGDSGLQKVALKVSSADGRDSESLAIVLRKPCTDFSCH